MALKRELNLFDATMVVVGGIIGTGIFVNPYIVARALDSTPLVLGAWFAGGVVAIIGALAYAELGQQQPQAGGPYVYLRDAWHPMAGFMYGWAQLLMIEAGGMAAAAGGLDVLVFTGGIGEHAPELRSAVAAGLAHLGVRVDPTRNDSASGDAVVGERVVVVEAREDLEIDRQVRALLA